MKKLIGAIFVFSIFWSKSFFAQPAGALPQAIVFYGAVTNSEDANIINMTDELFFTQLENLSSYTLVDRRATRFSEDALAALPDAIVFYAEILQDGSAWECTLHALVPPANKSAIFTKKYDTYYRILTDAKASISALFSYLDGEPQQQPIQPTEPMGLPERLTPTLSLLAGNWSGDSSINKVVLLRGGRGFVIFKNGASMSIEVKIEGSQVIVQQTSKPNASFYPDLPRDVALAVANDAPPIQWSFYLTDANTLTGALRTIALSQNTKKAEEIEIPSVWKRQPG